MSRFAVRLLLVLVALEMFPGAAGSAEGAYAVALDYRHRRIRLIPAADTADRTRDCAGATAAFSAQWHGEPATEIEIDLGQLTVGGKTFGPESFMVWNLSLPPGFDGFVGYPGFAQHCVCLDFPRQRLVITR